MNARLAVGCLLTAAATFGCQPRAPQFTAQDVAAVRSIFDSVAIEVREGNWDAWATHFAEDARFHPANAPALVGRQAILAWGKTFPHFETFSLGTPEVAGEGNLAYGWSSVILQLPNAPVDTSKQLVVFRRDEAGHWSVQAVSVNSDLPLPQPTPTPPR
jgi:ketosteroid isomerase-like protein